jgi:hypothetical protein
MKDEPNIAAADTLMGVFGYTRVETDDELVDRLNKERGLVVDKSCDNCGKRRVCKCCVTAGKDYCQHWIPVFAG